MFDYIRKLILCVVCCNNKQAQHYKREEVKMKRTCFDLISATDCNILLCTNDCNDKYK